MLAEILRFAGCRKMKKKWFQKTAKKISEKLWKLHLSFQPYHTLYTARMHAGCVWKLLRKMLIHYIQHSIQVRYRRRHIHTIVTVAILAQGTECALLLAGPPEG